MITLKQILESEQLIVEAAMTSSGPAAEKHVGKYLQPEQLKQFDYEMARDSGGAKKGSSVRVKKVVAVPTLGGRTTYHAHIEHEGGKAVVPIGHLMKPKVGRAGSNPEGKEDTAVDELHGQIQAAIKAGNGTHIRINHMGKTYNVAGARKVVKEDYPAGRKPKGDIILYGPNGESHIFLSHKASAKATGAQNYEGLSSHEEHPQVGQFLEDLKKKHPKGLKSGQSYVRTFTTTKKADKALHKSVMFGSEHASGEYGVGNVHSIAHGKVGIAQVGKTKSFQLTSDKFINNDETFKHNDHPIEFTARYADARKDHGIQNARIGIARIGSRPNSTTLTSGK